MLSLWQNEPVRLYAAFVAVVNLAVEFGLGLTAQQVVVLNVAFAAVLGLFIRNRVTPTGDK